MSTRPFSFRPAGLLIVIAALGLGGCASSRYCARAQPYDDARSVPPLQGTDGLRIPESPTAMRVPAETTGPDVPFGTRVEDPKRPGKTKVQCLDQPPSLPVQPAQPGDVKPKS